MGEVHYVYPDVFDIEGSEVDNQARARLYLAVTYLLRTGWRHRNIEAFVEPSPAGRPGEPIAVRVRVGPYALGRSTPNTITDFEATRRFVLAVYGGMLAENMVDPALGRSPTAPLGQHELVLTGRGGPDSPLDIGSDRVRIVPRFRATLSEVVGRYMNNIELFAKVLAYLEDAGIEGMAPPVATAEVGQPRPTVSHVFAEQLYRAARRLEEAGVGPNHPQLRLSIAGAVGHAVGATAQF